MCVQDLLGGHVGETFARLLLTKRMQVATGAILHHQARELRGVEMRVKRRKKRVVKRG